MGDDSAVEEVVGVLLGEARLDLRQLRERGLLRHAATRQPVDLELVIAVIGRLRRRDRQRSPDALGGWLGDVPRWRDGGDRIRAAVEGDRPPYDSPIAAEAAL